MVKAYSFPISAASCDLLASQEASFSLVSFDSMNLPLHTSVSKLGAVVCL
jgi:hypothetical protein